jgi:hypothetical protein
VWLTRPARFDPPVDIIVQRVVVNDNMSVLVVFNVPVISVGGSDPLVIVAGSPVIWQDSGPSVLGFAFTAYSIGDPWSVAYGPDAILSAAGGNIVAAGGGGVEP